MYYSSTSWCPDVRLLDVGDKVLEARLLGQFDVRLAGQPATIPSRAAQSLFAYLLLNPGTAHRREMLAGLFWPDSSEENAHHNLRQELWRIRKAVGPIYFHADDIAISLLASGDLWLDTSVLIRAGVDGATPDALMEALGHYRGELLPGFYDEWIDPERERLRTVFEQLMARLVEVLQCERRWDDVRAWAERWIALGRSPEPAYRALMLAYGALGDGSKVAATFDRCVTALRDDLGMEPSEQTRALFERLRTGEAVSQEPLAAKMQPPPVVVPRAADEPPAPGQPPFMGLRSFEEADADRFFGREMVAARLIGHLRERHPLVVVIGASGSGKSSIVRAGLIPALRRAQPLADGTFPPAGSAHWQMFVMTPTARPLEALAVSLTRNTASVASAATLMDDLARDPRSLHLFTQRQIQPPGASHLLLVVDQFEELFTLCHDAFEREAFVDNLLTAALPPRDGRMTLVLTLRADFYAHCAQYEALREAVTQHQEYIGPMNVSELRCAIEDPAQQGDWPLEPGLVDLILRDLGDEPGALPLLSHALFETWQRRRGRLLTFQGYAASGGVRGAISQTAETVYRGFTPEQQAIARNMFLRLTELGEGTQDTRRRVALSELVPPYVDAQTAEVVLKTLADARLVTTGEGYSEVAHEALIREWPALREWLSQDREGLRLHRHLTEAAQAWSKLNRDAGELYRGARLAQAQEWASANAGELNPLEREFLNASKEALERETAEHEARRERDLIAAQKLAKAETDRAEAEGRRAEAERARATEQARAAHELRQRAVYLIGALLLAIVMAVTASAFAVQSNQSAERAENERRIAYVRELSLNAVSNLDADPERSILLALQAVGVSTAVGKPVLLEAEEALHRAVIASRVLLTFHGHAQPVLGIAYSPDGRRLVTTGDDTTAKLWDAETGREILTLSGHTRKVFSVAYSPDGMRIATAGQDKTARLWDANTGQALFTLTGHQDVVYSVAFSPDSARLATSSGFGVNDTVDHTAKVWDVATGKELLTLSGHSMGIDVVTFSPDGKHLATGSIDNTAKIWDATSGKELLTLIGHVGVIGGIAFSPDGIRLATGSRDGTVKVWDAASGQLLMTIVTHQPGVLRVAFDSAGTRIVTSGGDGTAQICGAATGELLYTLSGHSNILEQAVFSPDGAHVATASDDGTARVWDVSPAGSREWLTLTSHMGNVRSVAYSPDGRRIATASEDKTAKVWDALTGQELLTFTDHTDLIKSIAFTPNGSRLVTTSNDQTAKVWDAATGKELLSVPTQSYRTGASGLQVAISPGGRRFAAPGPGDIQSTTGSGVFKIWDISTGKELLSLSGHNGAVYGIAFSPDGKRVATASSDRTAKVWDAETGMELLTLVGHTGAVIDVNFSPDGRRLATASIDSTAKVWDAATGQLLQTLTGHTGQVKSSVFSPDGTQLATTSQDGTTKVWDVSLADGQPAQPLTLYGHNANVNRAVFSPDGKRLVTVSTDGTARVWALAIADLVAIAKSRVTRSLTTDECQKYLHTETCPASP